MCWNLAVEFVLLISISLTLCFSSEGRNVKSLLHDDSSKSSRLISVVSVECNKPTLCTNPSNKLRSQSLERPNLFPSVVPPIVPSPPPTFLLPGLSRLPGLPGLPGLPVPLPPVIPGVPPANKHKVTP